MDRLSAGRAVPDAGDRDLPEQRHDRSAVHALVSQANRPILADHNDRLTDIAVAASVDVRLQREAQDLTAAAL